jgi:hypothetical protein
MTQNNVGALVVVKPGEEKSIAGIIAERGTKCSRSYPSPSTMKHFWRFTSKVSKSSKFNELHTLSNPTFIKRYSNSNTPQNPNKVLDLVSFLKPSTSISNPESTEQIPNHVLDLVSLFKPPNQEDKVAILAKDLIRVASDYVRVSYILDQNSEYLIGSHPVYIQLLNQLNSKPSLLLEVLLSFQLIRFLV